MMVYVDKDYNVFSYEQAFAKCQQDNKEYIANEWLSLFLNRDIIEDLFYDGRNLSQDDYEEYQRQKLEEILEDEYHIREVKE